MKFWFSRWLITYDTLNSWNISNSPLDFNHGQFHFSGFLSHKKMNNSTQDIQKMWNPLMKIQVIHHKRKRFWRMASTVSRDYQYLRNSYHFHSTISGMWEHFIIIQEIMKFLVQQASCHILLKHLTFSNGSQLWSFPFLGISFLSKGEQSNTTHIEDVK